MPAILRSVLDSDAGSATGHGVRNLGQYLLGRERLAQLGLVSGKFRAVMSPGLHGNTPSATATDRVHATDNAAISAASRLRAKDGLAPS